MKTKRMISLLLAVLLTLSVAVTPAFAASAGDLLPAAESADVEESNDVVSIRLTTSGELVYGSPFTLSVVTKPADTQYIGVVIGTKGEAKGYVTLVLSDKIRTLLKMIPLPRKMSATPDQQEEFNLYAYIKQLIDGNDVSVLLRVADEVVSVMDVLQFYMPTIKDVSTGLKLALALIRKFLPDGAFSRIYVDEQPTESGNYVAGAVALESGDVNTAGVAMFRIKPKTEGVRTYWTQEVPDTMTVEEAQNYDLSAVLEVDGQPVPEGKISYTYKKGGWFGSKSDTLPTQPGEYVQTATVGGNVSTNAGGMRAVKYGVTRDYVLAMTVVLPDGRVMELGKTVCKTSSGYSLLHLMIGSEGTLGVITELTLKLIPKPEMNVSLILPFADVETAIASVPQIKLANLDPQSIEFMERDIVDSSAAFTGNTIFPTVVDGKEAGAYILVTLVGDSEAELTAKMDRLGALAEQRGAYDTLVVWTDGLKKDVWAARSAFLTVIEADTKLLDEMDVVVPVDRIAEFLVYTRATGKAEGITIRSFGHAGDGNLHIYCCANDMELDEFKRRSKAVMDKCYAKCIEFGGQVSGEHAIGHAKKQYLVESAGETAFGLMQAIKQVFDPKGILNPGKVCTNVEEG